jgi:hypothetical protein
MGPLQAFGKVNNFDFILKDLFLVAVLITLGEIQRFS